MNGYEFKREIERIFKVARNMCPNVTDEMLYTNGAIHLNADTMNLGTYTEDNGVEIEER